MPANRYAPLIVSIILILGVVSYALASVPPSSVPSSVTLRVGYPDSLDQSTVSDLWAYSQILPSEGINVIPTFYDAPPLSYKGLLAGQQDIALVSSSSQLIGVSQGEQTTIVTCYALAGTFLAIAGNGATNPSQLLGGGVDDFGPGSQTRALSLYWFAKAGIPTNTQAPAKDSVYLRASGGNVARVHDIETGVAQAIVVDDFTLTTLQDPAVNNTDHHGPFHVLFYAPNDVISVCYAVRDDWLGVAANQQLLVKWIAAITQAQREFITSPQQAYAFEQTQLPLTAPNSIKVATTFYPGHYTYWPYGSYNLQGSVSIDKLLKNTNDFQVIAGNIAAPVPNSSVKPYGIVNGAFELQALQSLGPYQYPCQSWVDQTFINNLNAWVPHSLGSAPSHCNGSATITPPTFDAQTLLVAQVQFPFQLIRRN